MRGNKILDINYDELKEIIKELSPIGLEGFCQWAHCSKNHIYKIAGGKRWNAILKDCGLRLNMNKPDSYSEESIIKSIRDFKIYCENNNLKFSSVTYRHYGLYSQSVIDKVFGSWLGALNAAGLESKYSRPTRQTSLVNKDLIRTTLRDESGNLIYKTKEEAISEAKELYSKYGYMNLDLLESNTPYSMHHIRKAFGSVKNFYDICEFSIFKTKSASEDIIKNILTDLEIEFERDVALIHNPLNGNNLYYDFVIPELKIIIEVHGEQHYEFIPFFHGDEEQFQYRTFIDIYKANKAFELGYRYFEFPKDSLSPELIKACIDKI